MSRFVRDSSGVLINIDDSDYRNILAMRQQQKLIEKQNEQMQGFEQELRELRTMLLDVTGTKG